MHKFYVLLLLLDTFYIRDTCVCSHNLMQVPYLLLIVKLTAQYNVSIVPNPLGIPFDENYNAVEYLIGSDLNLTCSVTPAPPANSEFTWKCSNGCFADMVMEQTINVKDLNTTDSETLTCSFTSDSLEYHSEPLDLLVSGK